MESDYEASKVIDHFKQEINKILILNAELKKEVELGNDTTKENNKLLLLKTELNKRIIHYESSMK